MKEIEKKRLVLSESELKVGDLVEVLGCCPGAHRFILTREVKRHPKQYGARRFMVAPEAHGGESAKGVDLLRCIEDRDLFIIETGLEHGANPYIVADLSHRLNELLHGAKQRRKQREAR